MIWRANSFAYNKQGQEATPERLQMLQPRQEQLSAHSRNGKCEVSPFAYRGSGSG